MTDDFDDNDLELPSPSDPEESFDAIREAALRAGLDEYELSESDLAALDDDIVEQREALPIVAIVGRPNVGKSTLVNRIIGKRVAVVEDTPGVTRDRVTYPAEWAGTDFILMDTGGWEINVTGIDLSVAQGAEVAMEMADAIIFVVDATVGATSTDEHVMRLLRRTSKPVMLVANKVDGPQGELEAAALWNLGLGEPYPVSALHGRGIGDLLDVVVAALPKDLPMVDDEGAMRRIALVGRPNVGKSSLLNRLAGSERAVVNEIAGTTRDPVDEIIEVDGELFTFIDTAGIRRRVHLTKGADYYASLRTSAAVHRAELALVLLDGSVPLSDQDLRILSEVVDAGRSIVMVINKWDLVGEDERFLFERSLRRTSLTSRGRPASTCPPSPDGTPTASSVRWTCPWATGTGASRQGSSIRSWASSWRRTLTPCVAASSPRSCSRPRRLRGLPSSCCLRPDSWTRSTDASSSVACARPLSSREHPFTSRCECARSAARRPSSATLRVSPEEHGIHRCAP